MGRERKDESFLDDIDSQDHHVVMIREVSQEKKKASTVVSPHFFSTFSRSSFRASLFSSFYFEFSAKKTEKLYWGGVAWERKTELKHKRLS